MEFTVSKNDLVRELSLSQGVVEKKTTIPILSNVLVEVRAQHIELTATDLELGVRSSCPAKVVKEGSVTVPAKKLLDYVRLFEDGDIAIKLLENFWIQITHKRSRTRMVGMSRENFPVLPPFPSKMVEIPAGVLNSMISRTIFAISSEESRYTLNGALLFVQPGTLTMVATDGHRLAYVERSFAGPTGEIRALVPKKAMAEVQRLLAEASEDTQVEFAKDESHLFFRVKERLLISRQLSGQFPNYEAVMPKESNRVVVLDQAEVTGAIRRVAQFADERSHAVRLQLTAPNQVRLSSSSSESGESEETLEAAHTAESLAIGFNSQYLLDFLGAAGEGPISFEFKDEQSAGQLRPAAKDGDQYRYVVMPMRI